MPMVGPVFLQQDMVMIPHASNASDLSRLAVAAPLLCRITVSSYTDEEKRAIHQLVYILGGSFTKSMGRKNTHLLIRAAAGPKFAGCAERNVIPVTVDWLIDSAHAGQRLWHASTQCCRQADNMQPSFAALYRPCLYMPAEPNSPSPMQAEHQLSLLPQQLICLVP